MSVSFSFSNWRVYISNTTGIASYGVSFYIQNLLLRHILALILMKLFRVDTPLVITVGVENSSCCGATFQLKDIPLRELIKLLSYKIKEKREWGKSLETSLRS